MNDFTLYTCDNCEVPGLAIGDDCTINKAVDCLCLDCLRQMNEHERALWDDAFSPVQRINEVLEEARA